MAAYEAAREAICIRRVLMELGKYKHKRPITLNEDNQACIKLAENPCAAERTKSMDVKYHFLRERVADGEINMAEQKLQRDPPQAWGCGCNGERLCCPSPVKQALAEEDQRGSR